MENRLKLNKRPTYELPDDVMIGQYTRRNKKEDVVPNFEPDIVICNWGQGNIGKVREKKQDAKQLWIKISDKKILDFIINYNWKNCIKDIGSPFIGVPLFKKIILEEFYGEKYGK